MEGETKTCLGIGDAHKRSKQMLTKGSEMRRGARIPVVHGKPWPFCDSAFSTIVVEKAVDGKDITNSALLYRRT